MKSIHQPLDDIFLIQLKSLLRKASHPLGDYSLDRRLEKTHHPTMDIAYKNLNELLLPL